MNFWKDKNVVVTGGAGMVGSRLSELLLESGAQVTILDNNSRGNNYVHGAHYPDHRPADAGDLSKCCNVFRDKDAVFNLAGTIGGVYYNISHQADQYWSNMRLQSVPALAAARTNVPIFLQVSSVCVYAKGYNAPALEANGHIGEPEGANAGYAWAKRMGERVCSWAFAGTDTRYLIVRPTNIYGTRDYYDDKAHVIPALIKKFTDGREVVDVYGGAQTREFVYADDVAQGMMTVAAYGVNKQAYNLGTSAATQVSIAHLAELIKRLTRSPATINYIHTQPTGDEHRHTNSHKALVLGWKYTVGLEEGLKRVIQHRKEEQCKR